MDEFEFSNLASSTEAPWNLLPKPQSIVLQRSVSDVLQAQTTPEAEYTTDEQPFEERHSRPSTPYIPDLDESSKSPESWSRRQLSCPPKTPDLLVADPVKPEETPEEKTPSRDGRSSPEPNCSICLEKVVNRSFTNGCLHTFCFSCLLQWSKIKAECPLCKQAFKSIIHNVQENHKYDEYHIVPPAMPSPFLPTMEQTEFREFRDFITALEVTIPRLNDPRPFRYSTTVTSDRQRIVYSTAAINPGQWVIPPASISERYRSRFWFQERAHRSTRRNDIRKNVYSRDLWAEGPIDVTGRYRECSPEFYRDNPAQVHRLVPWLNRELNALIYSSIISVVIDMILRSITRFHIQSREFYRLLSPHLNLRTSHFVHEFYTFARSTFDMVGYDEAVTYGPNPSRATQVVLSDDSDSDVLVLTSSAAGPSGVGSRPTTSSSFAAAVSEGDSDDCQVVECVKPRHERTPEVIDLLSEDEQPVTSMPDVEARITMEDSDSPKSPSHSVDSEYVPNQQKKLKKKKAHKEDDKLLSKRKTLTKKLKRTSSSKSAAKKGKGKKRKTSSHIKHGMNSEDELKPTMKRRRSMNRRKIYSSDEAGPSSSYRNHLRSSTRPYDNVMSGQSSSYYVVPPLRKTSLPPSRHHDPYSTSSSSNDESAAKDNFLSDIYQSSPSEMNVSTIGSSNTSFSPEIGYGSYNSGRQDKQMSKQMNSMAFASLPGPSTSNASSLLQLQFDNIFNDDHLPAYQQDRHPSTRTSPPSSITELPDIDFPGPSDMSQKELSLKRSRKLCDSRYEGEYHKRKSKFERSSASHKTSKSPNLRLSPEALPSNSWIIKPDEVEVPEAAFLDVSAHTTSPSTDSSNSRPRLKSIIITRTKQTHNHTITSPVASSSYSSYPRRKHKFNRISQEHTSSSEDEW